MFFSIRYDMYLNILLYPYIQKSHEVEPLV